MEIKMERIDTNQEQEALVQMAKERVKKLKDFYFHMVFFMLGVVIYVLKTYYGAPLNFFPIRYINGFVMAIWTTFFAIQAVQLFFTEVILGKSWEEKQIKRIIGKNNEKQIWK
jgi:hypothetical protein